VAFFIGATNIIKKARIEIQAVRLLA